MAFQINGTTVVSNASAVTSSALTVDTNTLFVDAANNRVGIGTITPGTTLDVTGIVRTNSQFTSTVAIGTAPLVITSTTRVANLNVATAGTADTLTTARNINSVAFNGSADITITAANPNALTIGTGLSGTSYTGSAGVTIALATGYGDTQNPYASKTANFVLAAPNGAAGVPTFRAIVAADIPTLNQSTTGSAATLTTTRTLWGQNFNGGANVTGALTSVGNITGTGAVTLTATAGTLELVATGANIITATTNAVERLRIDGSGNTGIGTVSPGVRLHVQADDAGTNTVLDVLRLDRQSTGVPAIGIGVGLEFAVETSAGNTEIGGVIEAVTTGVTAAAENFDLVFRTMSAGAAAAERVRIASTGTLTVRGNIEPEANNTRNIGTALLKYNTMYATLFSGTAVEAFYADLAEIYETDMTYEPGTLVEFGGEHEVTITTTEFTTKMAGVISTNPAYLMNKDAAGQPIALKGRVPCKVVGPVNAGDFIVSSSIPGVGQASSQWIGGAVIGKVIKADSREEVRLVEVVIGVM
jgi:hypothetical protein